MGKIVLALFLLLFGITMLVSTSIPQWVVGLSACIAGAVVALDGWWFKGSDSTPG